MHVASDRSALLQTPKEILQRWVNGFLHLRHIGKELFGAEEHLAQENADELVVALLHLELVKDKAAKNGV